MNISCQHQPESISLSVARSTRALCFGAVLAVLSAPIQAAFLFEIDTDGLDDGIITFNPNFAFGGDTTTASQSVTSPAYGTTGGDSIFGGDGVSQPDTYAYSYKPSVDADNLVIPIGTDLGGGNLASGLTGGGLGTYRVYATWPFTTNVSGGNTRYRISTAGALDLIVDIDQNNKGSIWYLLGDINYSDLNSAISVTQTPTGSNTFVSMRSYGLLFERLPGDGQIPLPTTLALLTIGFLSVAYRGCRPARVEG